MHFAASKGNQEMLQLLIDQRCDIDVRSSRNLTPLHMAARRGHATAVKLLLDNGASLEATDEWGDTPLLKAASKGHLEATKCLLEYGANVSAENAWGETPLSVAAEESFEDVVRMLLKHKADPTVTNNTNNSTVHAAARFSNVKVFTMLLDAISDFDTLMQGPWSLLNNAALGGKTENLKILLDKRPIEYFKPDFEGRSALHLAARGGKLAAFEMLLDAGCNPIANDSRGRNILHYASMGSSLELIEKILQLPCSADLLEQKSRFTPLHWAAISGNAQVMSALVAAGLEETTVEAKFPKRASEWTPWSLSKFFNNEKLLSETESLFKLRNFPPDIAPGKRHSNYVCDSCESVSFFSFDYLRLWLTIFAAYYWAKIHLS